MSNHYDRYNGMEKLLSTNLASLGTDAISRQQAINTLERAKQNIHHNIERAIGDAVCEVLDAVENGIKQLPPIHPVNNSEMPNGSDVISRQAAIDALCDEYCGGWQDCKHYPKCENLKAIQNLPPAQPERTCVNCGRTVNNGGWYADGGTRCPIEEHYALPKDGFCHLWEKRNVTDDDYPERRTDE